MERSESRQLRRTAANLWTLGCRGIVVGLLLVVSSGCGPYIASCSWIEVEIDGPLTVVAPRQPTAGECVCLQCGAPGEYRLKRTDYLLEFWNGDRWYPELLVRAREPNGRTLSLQSAQLQSLAGAPYLPRRWKEFDYRVPIVTVHRDGRSHPEYPPHVDVRILDAAGNILGIERVVLKLETRRFVAFESI